MKNVLIGFSLENKTKMDLETRFSQINFVFEELLSFKHISLNQLSEKDFNTLSSAKEIVITSPQALHWVKENKIHFRDKRIITNSKKELNDLTEKEVLYTKTAYSSEIIQILKDQNISSVVHIAGNKRLPQLENDCKENGVGYQVIEVYQTLPSEPKIDNLDWDVLLFTSPSMVDSFLKHNQSNNQTTIICIGETTKTRVEERQIPFKRVVLPTKVSKESMLHLLMECLEKRNK